MHLVQTCFLISSREVVHELILTNRKRFFPINWTSSCQKTQVVVCTAYFEKSMARKRLFTSRKHHKLRFPKTGLLRKRNWCSQIHDDWGRQAHSSWGNPESGTGRALPRDSHFEAHSVISQPQKRMPTPLLGSRHKLHQ